MASTTGSIAMDSLTVVRPRWSYDVFLSFRGKDTRLNFTSHLLACLCRKGIHTFIDNEWLQRGKQIGPALLKAIEGSRFAVVVLSENYASSTWCLEELSKIVECTEWRGQTLIPIFYKVEPSVVRRQESGSFRTALEKHEERFKENPNKVQKWRDALRKASDISGEYFDNGNEADFIEKIAQLLSEKIGRQLFLHVTKNPVGLDPEIEKVKPLLRIGSPQVCFIGIVGTGGMGKTTLAKAIYNLFAGDYEGCSFLSNVREASQQYNGLVKLQKRLLSDFVGGKKIDVANEDSGIALIRSRLGNRKCLIVLDDVDHRRQMEALAGGCDWFGLGSRIIITTRDEHLLDEVGASKHRMAGLCTNHARQLLSWRVFGEPFPPTDYAKVFSDVLDYAKGLPLALTVLGSMLYGRDVSQWKSTIKRLKDIPNRDIFNVLKVSYDGLEEDEKAIFLYIVCFFKWEEEDRVVKILNGCGYHSKIGIRVLVERSLISIIQGGLWNQTLNMHDLIEEMGKDISRREKKDMLWTVEEIRSVLEDNTGTDAIQAIYLKFHAVRIRLNPKAFEKMPRLRMLILHDCYFSCGPSYLPEELRWLEWQKYPSPSLPPNFNTWNLVGIILSNSRITKLWDGRKISLKLTVINLAGCKSLLEIPDVSGIPNLKELRANGCESLVMIHESVGSHEKLKFLCFSNCIELTKLPKKLSLPSLRGFDLIGCCKLEKFPEISRRMEHVDTLDLSETSIKELPPSIENLTGLQFLNLRYNPCLEALGRFIYHLPSLNKLDLDDCPSLCGFMEKEGEKEDSKSLSSLISSSFPNLVHLHLSESNIISLSPCISKCYNLKTLDLSWSRRLKEVPLLPPRLMLLDASFCESLETFLIESLQTMGKIKIKLANCDKLRGRLESGSKMLFEWLKGHEDRISRASFPEDDSGDKGYHFEALIPGGDIPDRFYHGYGTVGKSCLRFWVHSKSRVLKDLSGFALSAALFKSTVKSHHQWSLKINGKQVFAQEGVPFFRPDHVWIVYLHLKKLWKEEMLVDGWNQFSFELEPDQGLKSCGASFIGGSGEVLNSSTEIEFLGAEEITHDESTEEAVTDDEYLF